MAMPADPIRQLVREGKLTAYDWADALPLNGFPDAAVHWRRLDVGESSRPGDYAFAGGAWQTVLLPGVVCASSAITLRPLGTTSGVWYVGTGRCEDTPNGSFNFPFPTLEAARESVGPAAVGVFISKTDLQPLGAQDPPGWDWLQYFASVQQEKQQESVDTQQLRDRLRELCLNRVNLQTLAQDEAREAIEPAGE